MMIYTSGPFVLTVRFLERRTERYSAASAVVLYTIPYTEFEYEREVGAVLSVASDT